MRKSVWLACALALCGLGIAIPAGAHVHVVQSGQRLGSIAKRYNVTVDDLRRVNGIGVRDPIKPGQRLTIPGPQDKQDLSKAEGAKKDGSNNDDSKKDRSKKDGAKAKAVAPKPLTVHTVYAGQRLASIAKRYLVTLEALCFANDLSQYEPIKHGQKLVIPQKDDVDGRMARRARPGLLGIPEEKFDSDNGEHGGGRRSMPNYKRAPRTRGYVTLVAYSNSWKGHILKHGNVVPLALKQISDLLGAEGDERAPSRLLELVSQVSDTFGGRAIRVVSGFRDFSYFAESRHKTGHALDFSIPGVPNSVVRDYLRTFKNVGVGYYPNSSFVHLDVRGHNSFWVDYAGPGQPPQLSPNAAPINAQSTAEQEAGTAAQETEPQDPAPQHPEQGAIPPLAVPSEPTVAGAGGSGG
ncbi:MAG TPA: LysM peptidoglycan-binding domain-containing protein [Polyangiaceae bacterium]|nr:LysM peptidoglycan-binding domain-containing protein [Polyangiaceae bacterium]